MKKTLLVIAMALTLLGCSKVVYVKQKCPKLQNVSVMEDFNITYEVIDEKD